MSASRLRMRWWYTALGLWLLLGLTAPGRAAGIRVESVQPEFPAAEAGIRPGDLLLTYDGKPLRSPATLDALSQNNLRPARVPVRLVREGAVMSVSQGPGGSGARTSMPLPEGARRQYVEAWSTLQEQQYPAALEHTAACAAAVGAGAPDTAAWVWWSQAFRFRQQQRSREAARCLHTAAGVLLHSPDLAARAWVQIQLGELEHEREHHAEAYRFFAAAKTLALQGGYRWWAASMLNNMGEAEYFLGKLQEAQRVLLQARDAKQRLRPGSPSLAGTWNNLGGVALLQHDSAAARQYFTEALKIVLDLEPGSVDEVMLRNNLGLIAYDQKDYPAARKQYEAARALLNALPPDPFRSARISGNLANVLSAEGDLEGARKLSDEAREILERDAPESLDLGTLLANEGHLLQQQGDSVGARRLSEAARSLLGRVSPHSMSMAYALNNLGALAYFEKRYAEARTLFQQGVAIADRQRRAIAAAEARSFLVEGELPLYSGLFRACAALGDTDGAFAALERARARSLSDLLFERRLNLFQDAPTPLRQREQSLDDQRNALYVRLSRLELGGDARELSRTYADLEQVELKQRLLVTEMRQASPRYASLRYPEPVTLHQAQAALDPGTLLLYYGVDDDATYLFAVTREEARLLPTLPVGSSELRRRVTAFREAVSQPETPYRPAARALYQLLLAPAREWLARSRRVLLCPDGPLRELPFPALLAPEAAPGAPAGASPECHLVEWKPLHQTVSMSLYAEARQLPRGHTPAVPELVAFGDPTYPAASREAGVGAGSTGRQLSRLFYTREQVRRIGSLFPRPQVFTGGAATEARVRREAGGARYLHFACHGILDRHDPYAAAVVLTPGGGDDGWLHAYEVLRLRLRADLVLLSACESGLGSTSPSEGILGMTRAFQYAGARTVGVTLWEIQDFHTTGLMASFYQALRHGAPKDEALRQAQCTYLRDGRTAHPYYWSAFELVGDWH